MREPNSKLCGFVTVACGFAACAFLVGAARGQGSGAVVTPPRKDAKAVVRLLESRYHSAATWKAVFLERYSEGARDLRVESGTAYFRRPGRMRWEYEVPEKKLFVADGKTVWFYVPADKTVTRAAMKESADWRTPLALLTGKAKLERLCGRTELVESPEGASDRIREADMATLRCLPRGKSSRVDRSQAADRDPSALDSDTPFDEIILRVSLVTGDLSDVMIRQAGGIEMEFRFGNWQRDVIVSDAMFRFQPPPGVAIVEESPGEGSGL